MPDSHNFPGLITYRDGRVAEPDANASPRAGERNYTPLGGMVKEPAATPLLDERGNPLALRIKDGPHTDVITYPDGRVAQIDTAAAPATGDQLTFIGANGSGRFTLGGLSADTIRKTREMQGSSVFRSTYTVTGLNTAALALNTLMAGGEIGFCGGESANLSILSNRHAGRPVDWTPGDQIAISKIFSDGPGRAFFCSNSIDSRSIAINVNQKYLPGVKSGLDTIRKTCASLLGPDSEAKCAVLKGVADVYAKEEQKPGFLDKHGGFLGFLMGVAVLLAFGTHGYKQWGGDIKNLFRKGPPDGDKGPTSPKGPGGGKDLPELTRDEMAKLERDNSGKLSFQDGVVGVEGKGSVGRVPKGYFDQKAPSNVIVDLTSDTRSTIMTEAPNFVEIFEPQIIERFEKYGVVPASKGGLMYQHQATIDGVSVGLPSGLADLHGADLTSDAFEKRVHEVAMVIPVPVEAASKFVEGSKPLFDTNGELFETTLETNRTQTAVLDGKIVDILDHPGLEEGSMYKTVEFETNGACSIAYEKVGEVYSGVDFSESRSLMPGIPINEPVSAVKTGGSFESFSEFEKRFGFTSETTVEQMIITLGNQEALFTEPKLATIFKNLKDLSKDSRFQKVYNAEQRNYVIRAIVETRIQENEETIKTWQEIDEEVWRSKIQPERMKVSERADRATSVVRKSEERRREAEKSERKIEVDKEAIRR